MLGVGRDEMNGAVDEIDRTSHVHTILIRSKVYRPREVSLVRCRSRNRIVKGKASDDILAGWDGAIRLV
jgi:hypothetical protein